MNFDKIFSKIALYITLFFLVLLSCNSVFADESTNHLELILKKNNNNEYVSDIIDREEFNSIIIKSDKKYKLLINTNVFNISNTWREVHLDEEEGYEGISTLFLTEPSHTFQIKAYPEDNNYKSNEIKLDLEFIFEKEIASDNENLYSSLGRPSNKIRVIKRKFWGANEDLRYISDETNTSPSKISSSSSDVSKTVHYSSSGATLSWPLSYSKTIKKIIIHHTASELRDFNGDDIMDSNDYKAILRSIYYYHAISRGWGDIGYNYIIDPLGNVYEGRYGGERVIGAHARGFNTGSIGISVMGNYQENPISEPAFQSLVKLIAEKASLYKIDPTKQSEFNGVMLYNVIGHRDVGQTSCPGNLLYGTLDKIRKRAKLAMNTNLFKESALTSIDSSNYNANLLSFNNSITLNPTERKKITLKFKNTGKRTWDQSTWLHVSNNKQENIKIIPIIADKLFVSSNMNERYVAPGQVASFDIEVEAGYKALDTSFKISPVINGKYKLSKSSIDLSVHVKKANLDYDILKTQLPKGEYFQGEKITGKIILKNTGNVKWYNYGKNVIRLGTVSPRDRKSILLKNKGNRLAGMLNSEVLPGQEAVFYFDLYAPTSHIGKVTEKFAPVIENVNWMDDKEMSFTISLKKPNLTGVFLKGINIKKMMPGEKTKISLKLKNTGDLPWDRDNMKTRIITRGIKTFKNKFVPLKEVRKNTPVDFSFWIEAPYKKGRYRLGLVSYFNSKRISGASDRTYISVPKPVFRARKVSQSSKIINMRPNQEVELEVKFKNIGNVIWRNKGLNTIHLASSGPKDRLSKLSYDGWSSKYRPANLKESVVKPGEVGTFKFTIRPQEVGNYKESFQLVIEHADWIYGSFVSWQINVSGDAVKNSYVSDKENRALNKKRASMLIKAVSKPKKQVVESVKKYIPIDMQDKIRVKISYNADRSRITANTNYVVVGDNNEYLFELVAANNPVNIARVGDKISATVGSRTKTSSVIQIIPKESGVVELLDMERRPSWNKSLNDNKFRDIMEIRSIDGKTVYINQLPLESYLKGLAEVSNNTVREKRKTIAILARTYARYYMSDSHRKFPGKPYDASDNPNEFQRYLGYSYELRSPLFAASVKSTESMVVTYNGKLIKTPYFSQSDGRTRSAKEVWSWYDTPYLSSVDDPYCKGMSLLGHGVGLSGYGANKMAEAGKTYDEIIKYYYQGVEIEKIQ